MGGRRGGRKPRDAGTGVVAASFGRRGAWLSIGAALAGHGFVELSGAPVFDEARRGDAGYVRAHRATLADDATAFLQLEAPAGVRVRSVVRAADGESAIRQVLRLHSSPPSGPAAIRLRFRGRLDRPPLAMITEVGDAPAPTGATTRLEADGGTLHVLATGLAARATIRVEGIHSSWHVTGSEAALGVPWPAGADALALHVTCQLDTGVVGQPLPASMRAPFRRRAADSTWLAVPAALRPELERVRRRALRYARECTALRTAAGQRAILTDHRLLPLSWTRDAYYQALLLLREGDHAIVADHLRWLWLGCDRPAGTWARSHHADGRRKDDVYQADQQLYPLLELADYWQAVGRLPDLQPAGGPEGDWPELVSVVLDDLVGRLSEEGLLATDENAADDPADLPHLLANQVLAVYTFERLAELAGVLGLRQAASDIARRIRHAAAAHFPSTAEGALVWAYAVDGRGGRQLYHDANDLPTAFAPLWGFCTADDPVWRRTMDFTFGAGNEAWLAGAYGGLGSRHTPGVWPLGLAQEWVARSLTGDGPAAEAALRRLLACTLSDASLPEASDPRTGRALARHWFAWPGALVGLLAGGCWSPIHSHHSAASQPA